RDAIDLRSIPGDRESNRCIQDHIEVVGVARILPEVISVNDDVAPEALLNANIELITSAGFQRLGGGLAEYAIGEAACAGDARQDQVLVIGRLEIARV